MTPYTDLTIDQLRSAILQRDEQLRVALAQVEEWKQSTTAVALASQEVENELKAQLDHLKTLLEECRVALEACEWDSDGFCPQCGIHHSCGHAKPCNLGDTLAHLKALEKEGSAPTDQTKSQ